MTRVSLCVVVALLVIPLATQAQQEPGPRAAHRALQLSTAGSLVLTAALGTITALNQPTLFSEGRCATGSPILGQYGCHSLSTLHGLSALLSSVLYTATFTLEVSAFDWPGRDRHGSGFDALSYVHAVGMSFQAIGGLLSAFPEIVGAERNGTFARVLRSVHIMTGYTIVTSFVITTAIEL